MNLKKAYAYDPETGDYVKEFDGIGNAEKELNLYRGAIHDALRLNRKTPIGGFLWSNQKTDKFPLNGKVETPHIPPPVTGVSASGGISISDFRKTNDVSTKVHNAIARLRKDRLYSLDEVYDLIGLRKGSPMLRATIDSYKENQGKGMADGKIYFGHTETVAQLKTQKSMS